MASLTLDSNKGGRDLVVSCAILTVQRADNTEWSEVVVRDLVRDLVIILDSLLCVYGITIIIPVLHVVSLGNSNINYAHTDTQCITVRSIILL